MFKKFKDKLAEEMKQSPARLQASMQQLAQAVSPALSNSSIQELSTSNFSLTEEGEDTPKNSPRHGFQKVDLMSSNSFTSDVSSLFPAYESPSNLYHLQSDLESASEIDDNVNTHLEKVSKEQLYSSYRKIQTKYFKYRDRYTDLAKHYRELEKVKVKLENVLVETQDKVLRRISDLKEQCQLEQQAKTHLEAVLRNDLEERDHIIDTLNTKVSFLQSNSHKPTEDGISPEPTNLINLSNDVSDENLQLKEKLKKLENIVTKYKESLRRNKENFVELQQDHALLKSTSEEKLSSANETINRLTEDMNILKKREEESVLSLAENKLCIHKELEDKEEEIKKLRKELKCSIEGKEIIANDDGKETMEEELNKMNDENRELFVKIEIRDKEMKNLKDELESKRIISNELLNEITDVKKQLEIVDSEKDDMIRNINHHKNIINMFKRDYHSLKDQVKGELFNLETVIPIVNTDISNKLLNYQAFNNVKNEKLISEIDNLNFKIYDIERNEGKMKEEMDKLEMLRTRLISTLNLTEDTNDETLVREIDSWNSKINNIEINDEYLKLKTGLTSVLNLPEDTNNDRLVNRIEEMKEEMKNLETSMSCQKDEYLKLNLAKDKNNDELVAEIDSLELKIRNMEQEMKNLETSMSCRNVEYLKLKEALIDRLSLREDANDGELVGEIEILNDKIHDLELNETKMKAEMKSKNDEYLKLNLAKDENNDGLVAEIDSLKLKIRNMEQEMKNVETSMSSRNEKYLKLKEALMDRLSLTEDANDCEFVGEVEILNDKIYNLEMNETKMKAEMKSKNDEYLKLISIFNLPEDTNNDRLVSEIEETISCQKLKTKLLSMLDLAKDANNDELFVVIDSLRMRIHKMEQDDVKTKEENLAKDKNNDKLLDEIESLRKKIDNLEGCEVQMKKDTNEYLELKLKLIDTLNLTEDTNNESLINEIDGLNLKIQDMEETIKNVETSMSCQKDDYLRLKTRLIDGLNLTKDTDEEKIEEFVVNLTEELERLKLENKQIENSKDDLKNEILSHVTRVDELTNDNLQLKERISELMNRSDDVKSIEKDFTDLQTRYNDSMIDLKNNNTELEKLNKKLESQLDETLITFQTKETQMDLTYKQLKEETKKLNEKMKIQEEEQNMRIKQLVKEFQAQLHDKDEELQSALDKRFDRQQNYESELIQQYKEQLKDFQVELTTKSEQIEDLITSNKEYNSLGGKELERLTESIESMKKEHTDELINFEKQWESRVKQQIDNLETLHAQEINELTKDWESQRKELENTSRVAMATVQSNTGSFHTLQQTLASQKRELTELRKLVKLKQTTLDDSTELEYLRNILFEYMMGKEPVILARVIAAVVKFDQDQTTKVVKKEEDKLTLLGSLGLL